MVSDRETQTYPASPAQQRLWLLDKIQPNNPAYNMAQAVRIRGSLNTAALERSINHIMQRHTTLKTIFASDKPQQIIRPKQAITLTIQSRDHNLTPTDNLQQLIDQEAQRPFNLQRDCLIRATLITLGSNDTLFIVTLHHIIFDRWSLGLFNKELSVLYQYYQQNAADSTLTEQLPPLAIQYTDYTQWRTEQQQLNNQHKSLTYWQKQLAGSAPLTLPYDYSERASNTHQGERLYHPLPATLVDSIGELAAQQGATLFMGLLSVFTALLHRWSGLSDINIGTPFADRRLKGSEHLLGFFVNTIVLRTQPEGTLSFNQHLKKIRQCCFNGYRHASAPFDKVVEKLQPNRQANRNPLFNIEFALQKAHKDKLQLTQTDIELLTPATGTSQYDITLTVRERDDHYDARIEYRTDLFARETIQWLLQRFEIVADEIINNPNKPLHDIALLNDQERQRILYQWNQTPLTYPKHLCVHELFQQQVAATPNNTAVIYNKQTMSYAQLECRANQLAHHLLEHGVTPDSFVGLCVERSAEMVVCLLAILKSGAAYLPLDKEYPADRLQHMLDDSAVSVLITQSWIESKLPTHNAVNILLDSHRQQIETYSTHPPTTSVSPQHIAYMIYTSGSTGKPKGVQVEHRNVTNFLYAMKEQPGLGEHDRLLALTTLSFDIAVLELYLPLISGATTVIADHADAIDGHRLSALLDEHAINIMQATPVSWRLLIAAGWQGSRDFTILCGGEAMPLDLARELYERAGHVWNMYGPTETTVWSSCYRLPDAQGPALIGRPIGNTQIYLLDTAMQPVPIGVPGELYIGGDGVTRGYLNRSELNAERFVADPFNTDNNARLYRTGDGARYRRDGTIEYQERLDNQVKVRGNRIELGEIECAISALETIAQCVVIVREDQPGDPRISAYCIAANHQNIDAGTIRQALRLSLPSYMIPQFFIQLKQLPLTPNGKIDRKALPAPDHQQPHAQQRPPVSDTEKQLASIWMDILDVQHINRHDNFFELGGHSILALQAIERISKTMGITLPPMAMIMDTLEQIAADYGQQQINTHSDNEHLTTEAADSTEAITKPIEVDYIGPAERQLFVAYHPPGRHLPPASPSVKTPVLLCYPLLIESTKIHWAYKQLACQLASKGHPVLRFDYSGTGDSAGEFEQANLNEWVSDIHRAGTYLLEQTNANALTLIGFRFGAILAALACQHKGYLQASCTQTLPVNQLIAWDPILSGRDYIASLHQKQSQHINAYNQQRQQPAVVAEHELLGYECQPSLLEAIRGTQLIPALTRSSADQCCLLSTTEQPQLIDFHRQMQLANARGPTQEKPRVHYQYIDDPSGPIDNHHGFKLFLPNALLRAIITQVSEKTISEVKT